MFFSILTGLNDEDGHFKLALSWKRVTCVEPDTPGDVWAMVGTIACVGDMVTGA